MAFATLPYPSMDFTPLDVLTADELDQIVANINAVNNGTVGTSQITDGSVSTAKLADGGVTTGKIAGHAVTEAKLGMVGTTISMNVIVGGSTIGTMNGTLITLGEHLAVLLFEGSTGWSDSGSGEREVKVDFTSAGFTAIKGHCINSWYGGDATAYQEYSAVAGQTQIDSYVHKTTNTSETRYIAGFVIGTI